MQLFSQKQWWSNPLMHLLHWEQCLEVSVTKPLQIEQKKSSPFTILNETYASSSVDTIIFGSDFVALKPKTAKTTWIIRTTTNNTIIVTLLASSSWKTPNIITKKFKKYIIHVKIWKGWKGLLNPLFFIDLY